MTSPPPRRHLNGPLHRPGTTRHPVARLGTALLLLGVGGCATPQDRVAEAAATRVARMRLIGPNDLQITSTDRTVALEVLGDSVFVYMDNSLIAVPATDVENVRYASGRLSFDIRGIGLKMFDVGDGTSGAAFQPTDAIRFVALVLDRQNQLERAAAGAADSGAAGER